MTVTINNPLLTLGKDFNGNEEYTIITPKDGKFMWPCLDKSSTFKDKPTGKYEITVALGGRAGEIAVEAIDQLLLLAQERFPHCEVNNPPYRPSLDADKNPVPGVFLFKFKAGMKTAKGLTKYQNYFGPPFGAKMNYEDRGNIGHGSIGQVKARCFIYGDPEDTSKKHPTCGVALQFTDVFVQEFSASEAADASEAGFILPESAQEELDALA